MMNPKNQTHMKHLANMWPVNRINAFIRHHAANLKNLRIGRARIWYFYYCAIRKLKGGGPRVFLVPMSVVPQEISDGVILHLHNLYDIPLGELVRDFLANVKVSSRPRGGASTKDGGVEL